MSATNFDQLSQHIGHDIQCVSYGNDEVGIVNVAIECKTCNEVLLDFDDVEEDEN